MTRDKKTLLRTSIITRGPHYMAPSCNGPNVAVLSQQRRQWSEWTIAPTTCPHFQQRRRDLFHFCLGFLRVICTSLLEQVRHFVLELELLTNPAILKWTTNCFKNWWITLEQQEVRRCPFCTPVSSFLWSIVVLTSDSLEGISVVFAKFFQAIKLQVSSNCTVTNRPKSRTKICAHSFVCTPHWL